MIAVPEALKVADKLPQAAPLQPAPVSIQLTPLFCASFCTVAVMLCVWPVCTDADAGFTFIAMGAGVGAPGVAAELVTVIVAAEVFVLSATDVAVAVTAAGEGTFAGAV